MKADALAEEPTSAIPPTSGPIGKAEIDPQASSGWTNLQNPQAPSNDDYLKTVFTNPVSYNELANSSPVLAAKKASPFTETLMKRGAISAFLTTKLGYDVTPTDYEPSRDAYAQAFFGKDKVTDDEAFNLIKTHYEGQDARESVKHDLLGDVALAKFKEITTGEPMPNPAQLIQNIKMSNPDFSKGFFKPGDEAAAIQSLSAVADYLGKRYAPYMPMVKQLYEAVTEQAGQTGAKPGYVIPFSQGGLQPATGGGGEVIAPIKDDSKMTGAISSLINMAPDDRQAVYHVMLLAAKRSGFDPKGFLKQLGQSLGRGTIDMANQTVRVGFELLQRTRLQDLQDFQSGKQDIPWAISKDQLPAMISDCKYNLAAIRVIQEVNALANEADPIKVAGKGLLGFAEAGAYGSAGMGGLLAASAVPVVGPALAFSAIYSGEREQAGLEHPNVDPAYLDKLSGTSALLQTVAMGFKLDAITGKMPVFANLLKNSHRLQDLAGKGAFGKAASYTGHLGIMSVEGEILNAAQSFVPITLDQIGGALNEDFKSHDFNKDFEGWYKAMPEGLATMVVLSLVGAGVATHHDVKNGEALLASKIALRMAGGSANEAALVTEMSTPDEKQARWQEIYPNRMPENIAAGVEISNVEAEKIRAQQEHSDVQPIESVRQPDGTWMHTQKDNEGNTILQTPDFESAHMAGVQEEVRRIRGDNTIVRDLMGHFEDKPWVRFADFVNQQSVQDKLGALEKAGDAEGVQRLWERIRFAGHEETDLSTLHIRGETTLEQTADMVHRGAVALVRDANPHEFIEETNHAFTRTKLANGEVTLDQLGKWLEQTEAVTGQPVKRNGETEIVESVADVAIKYAHGDISDSQLPKSFKDYVVAFIRVAKEAFLHAVKAIRQGFKEGNIDPNFEHFLAESTGLDVQKVHDVEAAKISQDLSAVHYSISKAEAKKPTDEILSPTGHRDWGVFTDWDAANSGGEIQAGPIRLLKGKHFGQNNGFGLEHIETEHSHDFSKFSEPMEKIIHRVLLGFNEVYKQPDGKLLLTMRRPTLVAAVELRHEKGGFYSVVTAFPKENPAWKPNGVRILDGRRAAFAQSERAPGPTAQGTTSPNPPLEPLPGKFPWDHLRTISKDVNLESKTPDHSISTAADRKLVHDALEENLNKNPIRRLATYERAKRLFKETSARRDEIGADKAAEISPESALHQIEQDRAATLADIAAERSAALEKSGAEITASYGQRIEQAKTPELAAALKREATARAEDRRKGIEATFKEKGKAAEADFKNQSDQVKDRAKSQNLSEKDRNIADSKYAKLHQSLRELDAILSVLPADVRGKVGGYTVLANLGKDSKAGPKLETIDKFLSKRVDMVGKALETSLKKEYDTALYRIFEQSRPAKDEAGKRKQGKLGADVHALFESAKQAVDWTSERAAAESERLSAEIAKGELSPQEEAQKLQEIGLISLLHDWKHADAERRGQAVNNLKNLLEGGYQRFQMEKFHRREELAQKRDEGLKESGHQGDGYARDIKGANDQGFSGKITSGIKAIARGGINYDQALRWFFGSNSKIANWLSDGERHCANKKSDLNNTIFPKVEHLLTKLGGDETKGGQLQFDLSKKNVEVGDNSRNKRKLSQVEMIDATLMWRQDDGKRHMEGHLDDAGRPVGDWHYNQKWVDEVESKLTPEAKAIRDFIAKEYADEWVLLNPVHRRMFGIDMPHIENYGEISVNQQQVGAGQVSDPSGFSVSGTSTPGPLRTRGKSIAEPNFRDALQKFIAHKMQMNHWIAYAEYISEARSVLGNRKMQNSMKEAGGHYGSSTINDWLNVLQQGGSQDASSHLALSKFIGKASSRAAQMALFGKASVLAIQATNLASAAAEMPTGSYVARMAALMSGNLGWKAALESPYMQRRLAEMPVIVRQAMEGLNSDRQTKTKTIVQKIGQLMNGTDALFTAGTYAIIYDHRLTMALKDGMPQAEAEAHARNEAERICDNVSQPTRLGARSLWENLTANQMGRVSWAFASDVRKTLGMIIYAHAGRSASEQFQTWATVMLGYAAFGSLIRTGLQNAKDPDSDWMDSKYWNWKRYGAMTITDFMNGIPVIGKTAQDIALTAFGQHTGGGGDLFSNAKDGAVAVSHIPEFGTQPFDHTMRDAQKMINSLGYLSSDVADVAVFGNIANQIYGVGSNVKKTLEK